MFKTIVTFFREIVFSLVFAWAAIALFYASNYYNSQGAYNLAIGIMWFTLLFSFFGSICFSKSFADANPETMAKLLTRRFNFPKKMQAWLFDAPDLLLFGYAAWDGSPWIAIGALVIYLWGISIRGARLEREAEFNSNNQEK